MLGGRFLRFAILLLLVVSPLAAAASPTPNRPNADGTSDQEITDMAADPSGQFLAAVVAVDASLTGPTGGLGLPTSGTGGSKPDVYMCDYGPATAPTSGGGCLSGSYSGISPAPGATQRVDTTVVTAPNGGNQGVFAVAGPGSSVSKWVQTSTAPEWTGSVRDGMLAVNVSIAPDGRRFAFATAATSPTTPGRIEVWGANSSSQNRESYLWDLQLQNTEGATVRPTTLDWSRTGNVLAVGTSIGLLLMDPSGARPPSNLDGISQPGNVNSVQVSKDGSRVVAGGQNGVFLISTTRTGERITVVPNENFSRGADVLGGAVQEVAMTLDASRFAAAAGNRVHFFVRSSNPSQLAFSSGEYDTGARISDMAYDETGQILVVVSGSKVFGFGPHKSTPIWQFDATASAFGGLDAPLKKVSVSDDGQRILVAGRTKTMAYTSKIAVAATLTSNSGTTAFQPTQLVPLTLSVRNAGSLTDRYTFVVEAPSNQWTLSAVDSIQLDPEDVGTVRFNMTVPAGASDGAYGVKVRVRSESEFNLSQRRGQATVYIAEPSFNFTIPRSVVLKVEAPDDLVNVQQGTSQTIAFIIRNEGNAEGVVNLTIDQELSSGASWAHRFEPGEQVRVRPGEPQSVNLVITAPGDVAKGGENVITIRAREGDTVEATDRITASVEAEFGTQLATNRTQWEFYPGQTHTITLNVTNIGNIAASYNLTYDFTPTANAGDWRVTFGTNRLVDLQPGTTERVIVTVKAVASTARDATLTLKTHSDKDPQRQVDELDLAFVVVEQPPDEDDDKGNPLPGPSALLVLVGVAAIALARRYRGGRRE